MTARAWALPRRPPEPLPLRWRRPRRPRSGLPFASCSRRRRLRAAAAAPLRSRVSGSPPGASRCTAAPLHIHTPCMFRSLAAAATRCHERPSGAQHAAPASRRAARGVPHRLHHRGALRRTASALLPSAPRAAGARGSAALGAPRRCPRAADLVFDAAGAPPRAGQTTPALRASCSRPPAPVPGEAGRYPPAAALLVRRLVVPVLNKLLQLPLHPL